MKITGSTLVEILIVVIILAIVAAAVVPQYTQASNDARGNVPAGDARGVSAPNLLSKVDRHDNRPAGGGSEAWWYDPCSGLWRSKGPAATGD